MNWLNRERIRMYPRIIGLTFVLVLGLNISMQNNWLGGMGGIIGFDFVAMYAAAVLYRFDISQLYNPFAIFEVERNLLGSDIFKSGGNIFTYPPHVASIYSIFTNLPYTEAFVFWTALSILFTMIAVFWMWFKLIPQHLKEAGFTLSELMVLIFSFLPLLMGIYLGQNHTITLLLGTGVIFFSLRGQGVFAGLCAGLLLYKPHLLIGILIIWVVWFNIKALISVGIVGGAWIGLVLIEYGITPYIKYVEKLPDFMNPFGVGRFFETTIYSLFATSLPISAFPYIQKVFPFLFIGLCLGLSLLAYWKRHGTLEEKIPVYIIALLFPFLASTHAMYYDLVLLIPALVLWSYISNSRSLLVGVSLIYISSFLLLVVSIPTGIALFAVIPLGMFIGLIRRLSGSYTFTEFKLRFLSKG